MKNRGQLTKWAIVVLGLVSLVLVGRLVWRLSRSRVATSAQAVPAAKAGVPTAPGLSRYDPTLNLELLNRLLQRPMSRIERDPFAVGASARPAPMATSQNVAPAPPAPPPPPPLKAVGYMEMPDGTREAYVSYNDQVYTVQEGGTITNKFRVVKVTPTQIEVVDASTKETLKLAIAQ